MSELFGSDPVATPKLEDFVGEGKKYRDLDAVAKALIEKDSFINQLQNEQAEARNELRARMNLEELADRLARKDTTPNDIRQEPEPTPRGNEPDLKTLVQQMLNEEKTKTSRETNVAKAKAGLKERFGEDYAPALKQVSEALGVSEKFLDDLASTSPDGFIKMVDSIKPQEEQDRRPLSPPSGLSMSGTPSSTKKNKAYYDDLRKKDINLYLSSRVQNEMYKEAVRQGEAFYQ